MVRWGSVLLHWILIFLGTAHVTAQMTNGTMGHTMSNMPDNGTVSNGNDTMAHSNHTMSPGNGTMSHGNGTMLHSNGTMSHENGTMSHGNGTMSHGDGTMSHGDGTMSHGNDTMSHDDGMSHDQGHNAAGHGTYFFLSVNSTILFMEWMTDSWEKMLGSCFGIGAVAVLYEGLKLFRMTLLQKTSRQEKYQENCCSMKCTCLHMLQTVLHMVQVFVSYCLMMVFMTFNVWLCVAVIGGAGVGYLIFGAWRRAPLTGELGIDQSEHCH